MREYTDRQILEAMLRKYDLPTAIIIQKYKDQLAEPIKDDEEFDSFSAGHKKVRAKLSNNLSQYLSINIYIHISVSIYIYISINSYLPQYLSQYIYIYQYLFQYINSCNIYNSIYLSQLISRNISLNITLSIYLSIYLSINAYLYLSQYLSQYIYIYINISLNISLSINQRSLLQISFPTCFVFFIKASIKFHKIVPPIRKTTPFRKGGDNYLNTDHRIL